VSHHRSILWSRLSAWSSQLQCKNSSQAKMYILLLPHSDQRLCTVKPTAMCCQKVNTEYLKWLMMSISYVHRDQPETCHSRAWLKKWRSTHASTRLWDKIWLVLSWKLLLPSTSTSTLSQWLPSPCSRVLV
jgi:hypothetical protein